MLEQFLPCPCKEEELQVGPGPGFSFKSLGTSKFWEKSSTTLSSSLAVRDVRDECHAVLIFELIWRRVSVSSDFFSVLWLTQPRRLLLLRCLQGTNWDSQTTSVLLMEERVDETLFIVSVPFNFEKSVSLACCVLV